jgi:hypothetical protein
MLAPMDGGWQDWIMKLERLTRLDNGLQCPQHSAAACHRGHEVIVVRHALEIFGETLEFDGTPQHQIDIFDEARLFGLFAEIHRKVAQFHGLGEPRVGHFDLEEIPEHGNKLLPRPLFRQSGKALRENA